MKSNAQRGGYAEISGAAAQGPKQVGVSAGICNDMLAILQYNLGLEEVVGGETLTSEQRPVAAGKHHACQADCAAIAGDGR